MKPVSIKFLGHCELISPNGDGQAQIGSRTAILLARLALPLGRSHDRKRLTELLWPDRGESQSLASLRQSLWTLRRAVGDVDPPPIVADRTSIRMDPACVEIDTIVFEQLLRSGTRDDLERAAEIYRGDYLSDVDLDDLESHAPLLFERQRLRDLHLSCLKTLISLRADAGDVDGALALAQTSMALDPLQDDIHATIIRLHRDAGRLGAARKQYDVCCEIFRRELDAPPPAEVEALRKTLGAVAPAPVREISPPSPLMADADNQASSVRRWQRVMVMPLFLAAVGSTVALLLLTGWLQAPRSELPLHRAIADPRPSVVVLPFADIGMDGLQSAFATGLTNHLITDLSRVSGLFVIAAETSNSIATTDGPPQQQAARLGVEYAVSGSVRRTADSVSVNVDMIRSDTGRVVMTRHYEGRQSEIFAVQDDIVRRISDSLGVELSQRERKTIDHVPTHNLEAQDFFLRAEYQTTGLSEADSLRHALAAYRRAFELDPKFAEAYAGYARTAATVWHHDLSEIMSSAVARHEAYDAAGKAMQIDPENARAYEVLSTIQSVEGEHDLAIRSARQAVGFQPGNAEAHANLANVLYMSGDLEGAAAEVAIARNLNPALPPDLRLISGMVAFAQHHYPVAIAEFSAIQTVLPRSELVLEHLAAAYAYLGDRAKAKSIVSELMQVVPIANLGLYAVLSENTGTPELTGHFIEGLRLAGIPEWPFGDQRDERDRLKQDELGSLVRESVWKGQLANGVAFVQYFDHAGKFAYGSTSSLLTGKAEIRNDQLCQVIEGYLLDHPSCGYVYRTAATKHPPGTLAYVSIDAVKYFSVSQ